MTDCSLQSHPETTKASRAQVNETLSSTTHTQINIQSPSQRVAKLIGEQCVLKCNLNGYAITALLDSGTQVSIIDRQWKQRYLQQQEVRPLCELLGDSELDLTAANGKPIPYDGWMELTFNLPGNDDPNLAIRVPFLVSCVNLPRPILGVNLIHELILGREGGVEVVAQLLREAMQIESNRAEAIVNYVQTHEPTYSQRQVK